MKNLADLLTSLGNAAMSRYEKHTGLNGIGEVINPLIQENAQRYAGNINLDPKGLELGIKAFSIFNQWMSNQASQAQVENTPSTNVPMSPEASPVFTVPVARPNIPTTGVPVQGYFIPNSQGRQNRRTGRQ